MVDAIDQNPQSRPLPYTLLWAARIWNCRRMAKRTSFRWVRNFISRLHLMNIKPIPVLTTVFQVAREKGRTPGLIWTWQIGTVRCWYIGKWKVIRMALLGYGCRVTLRGWLKSVMRGEERLIRLKPQMIVRLAWPTCNYALPRKGINSLERWLTICCILRQSLSSGWFHLPVTQSRIRCGSYIM